MQSWPPHLILTSGKNTKIYSSLQGERSGQWRIASAAHAVVLSMWQEVHGFGILYLSVMAGGMKANVCALTNTPGIVTSIFGM